MKGLISFDFAIGLFIFITVLFFSILLVNEEIKDILEKERVGLLRVEARVLKKEIEKRYLDAGYKFIIIPKDSDLKTCISLSIRKDYKYYAAYSEEEPLCIKEENSTVTIYSRGSGIITLFASNNMPLKHPNCSLENCRKVDYSISEPEKVQIFNPNKNFDLSSLPLHSQFCLEGLIEYQTCTDPNLNFVYYYLTQNSTSLRMEVRKLKIGLF